MPNLNWDDFLKTDIRIGTIIQCETFEEAKNPAYKLQIDFGDEIGVLKSSAQITKLYQCKDLINTQVLAVVNFPDKQIANIKSQCLVLGLHNPDGVVLVRPDRHVVNGQRLC